MKPRRINCRLRTIFKPPCGCLQGHPIISRRFTLGLDLTSSCRGHTHTMTLVSKQSLVSQSKRILNFDMCLTSRSLVSKLVSTNVCFQLGFKSHDDFARLESVLKLELLNVCGLPFNLICISDEGIVSLRVNMRPFPQQEQTQGCNYMDEKCPCMYTQGQARKYYNLLKISIEGCIHTVDAFLPSLAFWLRPSVVSVPVSLIFDTRLNSRTMKSFLAPLRYIYVIGC